METSIIISGFGGQGTLFAGQLLTYAALDHDKVCTWIPSYGPEMRGGTAHCTVIISDEEIGSPLVRNPDVVLAFQHRQWDKATRYLESFLQRTKEGRRATALSLAGEVKLARETLRATVAVPVRR